MQVVSEKMKIRLPWSKPRMPEKTRIRFGHVVTTDNGRVSYRFVYLDGEGNETTRSEAILRVSFAEILKRGVTTPHLHKTAEIPEEYRGRPLITKSLVFDTDSSEIEVTPDDLVFEKYLRKRFYPAGTNGFYIGLEKLGGEWMFEDLREKDDTYIRETEPIHCDLCLDIPYTFLSITKSRKHGHGMTYFPEHFRKQIEELARKKGLLQL